MAGKESPKRPARIAAGNFFFIAGLCFATWASRIPDIQHHLKLSDGALGSVLFVAPVGSMICLPLAGWLVTRLGSRICLLTGAFLYAIVLYFLGMVDTTLELVIALFFFGMFGNLMNISVNTQAVGIEAMYGRSIMASFHGLWSLAGFCGAAIGTLMVSSNIAPDWHFVGIGVLMIVLTVVFFRFLVKKDVHNGSENKSVFVLPDKALLNLGVIAFCCMACEGCMFDWSGIYFRDVVHTPEHLKTVGYTVFMAAMATGRFFSDAMVMRFGVIRILKASGILISSGLLISVIFPDFYAASFGFLLTGFGVSSVVPLAYGLAGRSVTMSAGMAIASVSTVGFLGFLLGPPVIGYIAHLSDLRWSFALMAFLGSGTAMLANKIPLYRFASATAAAA